MPRGVELVAEVKFEWEQIAPLPPYGELGLFRIKVQVGNKTIKRMHLIAPYNVKLLQADLQNIDNFWNFD